MILRNKVKLLLIIMSVFFLPALLKAQTLPPPPPDFGGDGDQVFDVAVPFDKGVNLLIAAAIVYGLVKVREKRKIDKIEPAKS